MLPSNPLVEDPSLSLPRAGRPRPSLTCDSVTPVFAFVFSFCVSVCTWNSPLCVSFLSYQDTPLK